MMQAALGVFRLTCLHPEPAQQGVLSPPPAAPRLDNAFPLTHLSRFTLEVPRASLCKPTAENEFHLPRSPCRGHGEGSFPREAL